MEMGVMQKEEYKVNINELLSFVLTLSIPLVLLLVIIEYNEEILMRTTTKTDLRFLRSIYFQCAFKLYIAKYCRGLFKRSAYVY